jgi:hypothetical protein
VAAAAHDCCIIPITPENVGAWLTPSQGDLQSLYSVLEHRERPYYEHLSAADAWDAGIKRPARYDCFDARESAKITNSMFTNQWFADGPATLEC